MEPWCFAKKIENRDPFWLNSKNESKIAHVPVLELLIGGPESGPILVELENESRNSDFFGVGSRSPLQKIRESRIIIRFT